MNQYYLLALAHIPTLLPATALKLQQYWPDLSELFSLSQSQLIEAGLKAKQANMIANFNFEPVDKTLAFCKEQGHFIITFNDDDYPALLKEIANPPLVLYASGNPKLLNKPGLAIVGSRNPTSMGKHHAFEFAKEIATNGLCITSGLAIGIDSACHQGALEAGGETIAVMATGIDEVYPRRNHKLAENIKRNGLLITEFPIKSPPQPRQFPRRNRIISGLSLGTLVVEAAIKSGSLITARRAIEQNREVFAMPGSINNPMTQGCHLLLQQGAKLVTKCDDILTELVASYESASSKLANKSQFSLANNLQNLVEFVNYEVTSVNNIAANSGLEVSSLLSQLVELELHGLIKTVPGGYVRC